MNYEEIGELIGNIKFEYIQTGEWDSLLCNKLLELTRHVPLMVGQKRGIHPDDIQDIVQQSYQAAFRYLIKLDDDRTFPRYLYTIADNLCRKYWQKKIQMGHQEELEYADSRPVSPRPSLQQFEKLDIRENLRDAVDQLPDIYREAIELFYFGGLKAREIARKCNISTNTVTSRVRRGRMMLKEILEVQ